MEREEKISGDLLTGEGSLRLPVKVTRKVSYIGNKFFI
jgi:hypothetical protein